MPGEQQPGDRLRHHGGGGEDEIGDHHDARHRRDGRGLAGEMRHQHEERDPGAGPEQDRGADDVQVFEDEVGHRGCGYRPSPARSPRASTNSRLAALNFARRKPSIISRSVSMRRRSDRRA